MTDRREEAPCIACGAPSCPLCGACHDEDCTSSTDVLCDFEPAGMTDVEADADTLASAGMGTDEDYGYYGEEDH